MATHLLEASIVVPVSPLCDPRRSLSLPYRASKPHHVASFLSIASPTVPPSRLCAAGTLDPEPAEETPTAGKDRRKAVRIAWEKLVRWSRSWRSKSKSDVLERTNKVVVLGGGSFGTAMAAHVASRKAEMEVVMLVRDADVCGAINDSHFNRKYFAEHELPGNIVATMSPKDALLGADFCLHAVPVQFSSSFLQRISEHVDPNLPFISLSKGLELNTLRMMSQIIPQALGNPRQPFIVLSGPSFAVELMGKLPTAMVVASKDKNMASAAQQLLASPHLRISSSRSGNCRSTKKCTCNSRWHSRGNESRE